MGVDNEFRNTKPSYVHELPQFRGAPFFIRKFNNDTSLTAEQLRQEESDLISTLYSDMSKIPSSYHISDYYRLCGGQKLVSYWLKLRY